MINELEKYKALSDLTRTRILNLLYKDKNYLCVCELTDVLYKPTYAISRALSVLKKADLVEEKRAGKFMLYRIIESTFNEKLFSTFDNAEDDLKSIFKSDLKKLVNRLKERSDDKYCSIQEYI